MLGRIGALFLPLLLISCGNSEQPDEVASGHASFNETDLAAIAQEVAVQQSENLDASADACSNHLANDAAFTAAANRLVERYVGFDQLTGVDADIRTAILARPRHSVVAALAQNLRARAGSSLLDFFTPTARGHYERVYCAHHDISRQVSRPLMDIGAKTDLLQAINLVAVLPVGANSACPPPPVCPTSTSPVLTVARLDRNFIIEGARNVDLTIISEGINLPTNVDGTINSSSLSIDLVNLDDNSTAATINRVDINNQATLTDFPNYFEFNLVIRLPNNLPVGHYRLVVKSNNIPVGTNSTHIAEELFEVRRRGPAAPETEAEEPRREPVRPAGLPLCRDAYAPAMQGAMRAAGNCR